MQTESTQAAKAAPAKPADVNVEFTAFRCEVNVDGRALHARFTDGLLVLQGAEPLALTMEDAIRFVNRLRDPGAVGARLQSAAPPPKANGVKVNGTAAVGIPVTAKPDTALGQAQAAVNAEIIAGIARYQKETGAHPASAEPMDRDRLVRAGRIESVLGNHTRDWPAKEVWEELLAKAPEGWWAKQVALQAENTPAPAPAEGVVKRGPGRPPGSKNKATTAAAAHPGAVASAPPPAVANAPVARPEIVAEIRTAYRVGPAMLTADERTRLVTAALDDGVIEAADRSAPQWELLLRNAPQGWFTFMAKSCPVDQAPKADTSAVASAEPTNPDPAGLLGTGGDPDGPLPTDDPAEAATGVTYDLAYISEPGRKLYEVIVHLYEKGKYETLEDLVGICEWLRDNENVPAIARVQDDLRARILHSANVRGVELK